MQTRQRGLVGLVLALLLAALLWGTQDDGTAPGAGPQAADTQSATPSPTHDYTETNTRGAEPSQPPGTDPVSGLPLVVLAALPAEAAETVELIDAGGPFPEDEDGGTFGNREELLPDREQGYYSEYTVPTPGSADRGARRIVAGDGGELYWTSDHYRSFERIVR